MSTLAFQTRLDQTLANSNIDAFVRDSKSNPSDRKAHNNLRDSPHEAHSSSISSSPQWSKNTRPPRDSSAEDIRFIKPHHSPVAGKHGSSEAFVTQHQAYHPEEYYQERLPDGLRILVTRDFDVGYFLDLSGLTRPDLIRPRLFARLGINEEHHRNWQLFRYGGSRLKNYPLDDSQVWDLCLKAHQYLLLLVLVVVPNRLDQNFINCNSLEYHAVPSNLPHQTRCSQLSASLESSDSWPAPYSPTSDINAGSALNSSHVSSQPDAQRFDDRDQRMPSDVSYNTPSNLTKPALTFKHHSDLGVSRPLYIPGHIPAPLSHLTRSASRLGKSPDGSSKSHVRQNRSTSDSYTLSSSALNMRAHIDTSPRPMATQNIATPPTRDSKKDLAICDEQVALTLPDLTTQHHPHEHDHALISLRGSEDDLRKSSSSVSSRQSHPNHKPATKASSAIAFIHSAASKIDNVLFKLKTADASPQKSHLSKGLIHPTSPCTGPVHDHIQAVCLPSNCPSESLPTSVSPRTSYPYEQPSHQPNINYYNHSPSSNAQVTAWTHNISYGPDEVVCSLNSSNPPVTHALGSFPPIGSSRLPDSNSLLISSHNPNQHIQSCESIQDDKQLVLAQDASSNHRHNSLHDRNQVDTSHIIVREPQSSKDHLKDEINVDLPDKSQPKTLPALELEPLSWDPLGHSFEEAGEDLKTMTEKRWEELVKNRPRSVEEESQSGSPSCDSLNQFSTDYVIEEDDEDFEPSEFQVEMKEPQKKVIEEETQDTVPEQAEADRASTQVNFNNRTWAVRPPVAQVYEKLEKSFPYHNLDEQIDLGPIPEIAKEASLLSSPNIPDFHEKKAASCPTPSTPSKVSGEIRTSSISRARSIRIVAEEQKRLLSQPDINRTGDPKTAISDEKREGSGNTLFTGQRDSQDKRFVGLSRIKSTKLWGMKTEEVPPMDQGKSQMGGITKTSSTHRSSQLHLSAFKWARGRLIGKGSFGEVYLALNITKGEMLAVKRVNLMNGDSQLIPGSSAKHGHAVAALRSEIIMLKDLEHPNIVQYLGFEETAEFASIFLEYVPGGSIGGCIRAHGAFELQVTKSFTIQTVEGLKYLHHSGILHRDLKSDNILVDLKGICKIADFGISKVSSKLDAYQTNTCMSFKGTAFYMAPEIITNQKGYSAKADIWSLGCVVLEMMCGRRPWSEQNQFQALFKVGSEGVGPPIPGDLELDKFSRHFFRACFSRNPKDRPMADKLSHHLFLTLDSSWSFESSELFRAIGTQKIDELFNE